MLGKKIFKQGGFTLIELLVVVVILGILAAVIVPKVMDAPTKANISKAKQDIRSLESALNLYKLDNHTYPTTEAGLSALKPKYVDHLYNDPWDKPYQYLNPGVQGQIDIYTLGLDGAPGGTEENADIGNWNLDG